MRTCNRIGVGGWCCLFLIVVAGAKLAALQGGKMEGKHPVLSHGIEVARAADYERAVARIMAMNEEEMLRLVPTRSGILFCGCPNCPGGQQENNQFEWSIDRPYELRCRFCGHTYPSEQYPANQTATGVNMLGEPVTYRYYFDEKSGRDFWFEACADYYRRHWFVSQCLALARAYHATRKPEYARRAALILDRFAEAYPHMAVLGQWPYRRRVIAPPNPPFPNAGGKWGRWMADEIPHALPEAYDLIYESEELDRLSQERGVDVRRRIENDFFRATIDYVFTFGKEPADHLNNMAGSYTCRIVQIGRIIGEPEYVHWGHRWVGTILRQRFFYDGMWCEAPSYHSQILGGIRSVVAALKGYSDPPGYRSPSDGLHLENVDLAGQLPAFEKAMQAPERIRYPNGQMAPVHDTWASARRLRGNVREETTSTLLPGFGHASLGTGRGANQIQAQLHFSGGYGHHHADNLNLALFAKGSEMLSDIGYTHSKLRYWTTCTVGHNTVAIDRENQATRDADGDLLFFVPNLAGVAAVEARAPMAYPGRATEYRRTLLLVPISESDAYVVDLFRVKGGTTHDWLLHGSADCDMTAECSLRLAVWEKGLLEEGEEWKEPLGESSSFVPYGLMRDVQHAQTGDPVSITFRYAPGSEKPFAGTGVHTRLVAGMPAQVFLARTPRVRPAEGDDRKVYDYWMPQVVVRRRGVAPLSSLFVAVHEPFTERPFLRSVRPLTIDPANEFCAAVEVCYENTRDVIVSTLDEPPYPERRLQDGTVVRGRLALIRERSGAVSGIWLIDGLRAGRENTTLTLNTPRYEGLIEQALRQEEGAPANAFVTSVPLPVGDALAGRWMIVTHGNGHTHGYEIAHVERREGKSVIVLRDDHGLKIDGEQTEEVYFPGRKITGPNRFLILGEAAKQW